MKLISWWGGGKIDQPLISGDKIVEFGIAVRDRLTIEILCVNVRVSNIFQATLCSSQNLAIFGLARLTRLKTCSSDKCIS
jgi:hypothetical protein